MSRYLRRGMFYVMSSSDTFCQIKKSALYLHIFGENVSLFSQLNIEHFLNLFIRSNISHGKKLTANAKELRF